MGNCGLALRQKGFEVAGTDLISTGHHRQNSQSNRVSEQPQYRRNLIGSDRPDLDRVSGIATAFGQCPHGISLHIDVHQYVD